MRSLAGALRGDGNFTLSGLRYPFRVSSRSGGRTTSIRVHLNDPGARPLAVDLDGVLWFEARAPRFEQAHPPGSRPRECPITPWKISAKVKAIARKLDQLDVSYGTKAGTEIFGPRGCQLRASPLLHATLSARQLDARPSHQDSAKDSKDASPAEPLRVVPGLRALTAGIPQPPVPTQIEFSAEQIMMGGRPVQNLTAEFASDANSWSIQRLDLRAPGATLVSLTGTNAPAGPSSSFTGALSVESSDPDALAAWLQGRPEVTYRSQKPLRLRGNVSVATGGFAIEAMKAEIEGGAVEGRMAL